MCIPGNGGPRKIMIEDLLVKDFEVAGIQFNGAKDITIRRTTVGPSGKALVSGLFIVPQIDQSEIENDAP
jgi:hypothetical protein